FAYSMKHSERNRLGHLDKHVFVLCIAHNQDTLSVLLAFDELKTAERRIRVDERDGAVVVLAGRHAALAAVQYENRLLARFPGPEFAPVANSLMVALFPPGAGEPSGVPVISLGRPGLSGRLPQSRPLLRVCHHRQLRAPGGLRGPGEPRPDWHWLAARL